MRAPRAEAKLGLVIVRSSVASFLLLLPLACGDVSEAPVEDSGAEAGCALDVPLFVDESGGEYSRIHVPITYEDAGAVLLLDTGSGTTFVQEPLGSPDPVYDAGTFVIGCESVNVDGRPEAPDDPSHGMPSVGTLGLDLLLRGPAQVDFAGAALHVHAKGDPLGDPSWANAPFDVVSDLVLAHVTLDGQSVRLMLDTGAGHTLWLGQQPEAGDTEVDTTDALGNVVKMYYGTATLGFGAEQTSVPVLRVPSWPYFEQTVKALGGNVHGLLGLSSMKNGFVIDPDASVVYREP